uniref:Uncharacterized protein n=1 Tax=Cacopsylla melanoneura TaxID=428564 RepID=A0A8D9EJN3_9HEMI
MKGKTITPDRIRHDSSLSDVICLDTDMEDNDIEMVHSPLQLPLLSPINNFRTPSKTPNTVTPMKSGNHQSASDLSLNQSEYTMSTPVKPNLVSENQTPVKVMPPSAKKPISSHTIKNLIYSKQACSDDHVFWVNKFKKQVQVDRRFLHRLKGKVRKAKNYSNFDLAASLESEIQAREEEFAKKHIQRIQVTDNLSTYQPMDEETRGAIYNRITSAELFQVRTCSQQQSALITLRQYKENLLVLQQLNNKHVPLVANELYYKEQLYKKVYLTPKIIVEQLNKKVNLTPVTPKIIDEQLVLNISATPKESNTETPKQSNKKVKKKMNQEESKVKKVKKQVNQEKRSQKRKQNKMLKRLKRLSQLGQLFNTAVTGNKITKPVETNINTQSEPTLNVYDHNTTNSSESSKTPVSSRASPRPNNIQPSRGTASESTPVKFPSASKFPPHRPTSNNNNRASETTPVKLSSVSKFQPYRSLLSFAPVDS